VGGKKNKRQSMHVTVQAMRKRQQRDDAQDVEDRSDHHHQKERK
jgi:hypothetical protein